MGLISLKLTIFAVQIGFASAFSSAAGGCSDNGNGSIPNFTSHGIGATPSSGGELSLNNANVYLAKEGDSLEDRVLLDPSLPSVIEAGVEYLVTLSVDPDMGGRGFRGFLKRLDSENDAVDTISSMRPFDDSIAQVALQCTVVQQIGGVTHRGPVSEPLTSVSSYLIVDDPNETMTLDVTIVISNRVIEGQQTSEYYWSRFRLNVVEESSESPSRSPPPSITTSTPPSMEQMSLSPSAGNLTESPSETPSVSPPPSIISSIPSSMGLVTVSPTAANLTETPSEISSVSLPPSISSSGPSSLETMTLSPSTGNLTEMPSDIPSAFPVIPPQSMPSVTEIPVTVSPSVAPTVSNSPTASDMPSDIPSDFPSDMPSIEPSMMPGVQSLLPTTESNLGATAAFVNDERNRGIFRSHTHSFSTKAAFLIPLVYSALQFL